MKKLLKKLNCPGRFFEILGYVTVAIGLLIMAIGLILFLYGLCTLHTYSGAESVWVGLASMFYGLLMAVIGPQIWFALSKVVKAAEKYLAQ